MKRLAIFFLSLLVSAVTFGATTQQYCGSAQTTWQVSNVPQGGSGYSTWGVTQDSAGNLHGTISNFYCAAEAGNLPYMYISDDNDPYGISYAKGNGVFYFIIYNDGLYPCFLTATLTIPKGAEGCGSGSLSFSNNAIADANEETCWVPSGEGATTFYQWDSQGMAHFQSPITGANGYNWSGRQVTFGNGTASNTCNPPVTPYTHGSTPDYIDITNTIDDSIGWLDTTNVNAIRVHASAPCQSSIPEVMYIDCPTNLIATGWYPFTSDTIVYSVNGPQETGNTISLYRASVPDGATANNGVGQVFGQSFNQQLPVVAFANGFVDAFSFYWPK